MHSMILTSPLSTKANPGNAGWTSSKSTKLKHSKMRNDYCAAAPKTPCGQRSQQTPRPQWSLPRAHFTCADSPASDGEASDTENDEDYFSISSDDDTDNLVHPTADKASLGYINGDNKENMSFQHNVKQQKNTKQPAKRQSLKQPMVSVADTSREKQLAQKCYDSAMEIMSSDSLSAVSGVSEIPNNDEEVASGSFDDLDRARRVVSQAAVSENDTVSRTPSNDSVEQHIPTSSAEEDDEFKHSDKVEAAQSPNESATSSCEDTLSPLPTRDAFVRSPVPSVAYSNVAPTEASSIAASSAVTDMFAALRTTCSTVCGDENNEKDIINFLSPVCLTAERKRWIQKTLLSKREYTPYQTKERDECCKNKDSRELTTVRKRWIEETLLTPAQDAMRKMSPKHMQSSFIAKATSHEQLDQSEWQVDEPLFGEEAGDDSTVASPMKSPEQCHQLDNSFLASALVATNMLLTPPRRERYSSKPYRPRMSIGATPLPFAGPFSPSSSASSAFTEAASNIILHAIKQLSPTLSPNKRQDKQVKMSVTPSRKSDLISIVEKMDYLDTVGSHISKDEQHRSRIDQIRLEERVEKLEQLITRKYKQGSDNLQEEINELRRELHRSKHMLDKERQLVEEANQREAMLMSNLQASLEAHCDVEKLLRERIQSLEAEVDCLKGGQKQLVSDQEKETIDTVTESKNFSLSLEENNTLRQANIDLLEKQRITEMNHRECKEENENLRSQLLALADERSEKEQYLASALENVRIVSESFSGMKQKLEQEVNAKEDEVACMQRSLEFMSCELIESTNEVKELRSENARLHDELKKMKTSRKWLF